MDPFEEFEFKPLTEGLGFHRKNDQNTQKTAPDSPSAAKEAQGLLSEALFKNSGLDLLDEEPTLKSPLPRRNIRMDDSRGTPSAAAVDEILKTLSKNPAPAAPSTKTRIEARKTIIAPLVAPKAAKKILPAVQPKIQIQEEYTADVVSFAAFLLDGLLILASSLLCMILLLAVTKVDLIANIARPDQQGWIYLSTFTVFMGVAFIYYTVNRAFLGYTPGEWAYDQRLGHPEELNTMMYIPKILTRWILIVGTGVFLIPVVSKIVEKDFLGEWLGIPLMRKS